MDVPIMSSGRSRNSTGFSGHGPKTVLMSFVGELFIQVGPSIVFSTRSNRSSCNAASATPPFMTTSLPLPPTSPPPLLPHSSSSPIAAGL